MVHASPASTAVAGNLLSRGVALQAHKSGRQAGRSARERHKEKKGRLPPVELPGAGGDPNTRLAVEAIAISGCATAAACRGWAEGGR